MLSHFIGSRRKQAGRVDLPILAIVGIITVLGGAAIALTYTPSKARANLLVGNATTLAAAVKVMIADTGCIPIHPNALWDKTQVATASNLFCNQTVSNSWSGPYVEASPINAAGDITFNKIADASVMTINRVAATNNFNWIYYVQVSDVDNDTIQAAMQQCTGATTNTAGGAIPAQLQTTPCGYATGSTNTFYRLITMTQ